MGNVVRCGISLDPKLLEQFDELIARLGYANRSEAIRDLVRDRLLRLVMFSSRAALWYLLCTRFAQHEIRGDRIRHNASQSD